MSESENPLTPKPPEGIEIHPYLRVQTLVEAKAQAVELFKDEDPLAAVAKRIAGYITALARANGQYEDLRVSTRVDQMTELHNRSAFYEDLEAVITKELDSNFGEEAKDGDSIVTVIRFDAGMLNMQNALRGHREGDRFKITIADLIRTMNKNLKEWGNTPRELYLYEKFDYFRTYIVGGDEFAMIVKGTKSDVETFVGFLQEDLLSPKSVPDEFTTLEEEGDTYHLDRELFLDYGISYLDREVRSFLINEADGRNVKAATLLDMLSDQYVDIRKAIKRLRYFASLVAKKHSRLFERIYPYAAKGALGVSQEEIEVMLTGNFEENCRDFVIRIMRARNQTEIERIDDPFRRDVRQFITNHISSWVNTIEANV